MEIIMKISLKILLTLLLTIMPALKADEYVWGTEFQEGDTVSAEVFNLIFDTIETINRTIVDTDLLGTWTCDSFDSNLKANDVNAPKDENNQPYWKNHFLYRKYSSSTITFSVSTNTSGQPSTSSEAWPYTITTSSPNPISVFLSTSQYPIPSGPYIGSYILKNNNLWMSTWDSNGLDDAWWDSLVNDVTDDTLRYAIDLISPTKFIASIQPADSTKGADVIACNK